MNRPQLVTVPAPCGTIRGRIRPSGIEEYLGIPYAKAERFCPPRPVSWNGRIDCMEYGPCAPQPNYLGEKPEGVDLEIRGSEDCLNLNLWAQPGTVCRGLPVIVYIHGGGFQVGRNSEPAMDGGNFIQAEPIIFISVNYRLGALGFLQLGEEMGEKYRDSGNCGALDVLEALRWVHDNVEAFGGDPERVYLLGISAGAKMIGCLLTMPELQDLAYGIILESGTLQSFRTPKTARNVARRFEHVVAEQQNLKRKHRLSGLAQQRTQAAPANDAYTRSSNSSPENAKADGGMQPDPVSNNAVEASQFAESLLLTMPMEDIIRAQAEFCDHPGTTCWFGPVLDDRRFPANWHDEWRKGRGWKGIAILGSCARELCLTAERPDFEERKDEILTNLFGDNAPLVQECYDRLSNLNHRESTANWTRILSDYMYRSYTDMLAKKLSADGNDVWVYSFRYGEAHHGMGFHYLMHDLRRPGEKVDPAEMLERRRVAREMRGLIRRFVCTDEPEEPHRWPKFQRNSGYVKMIFDAVPHTESCPRDSIQGVPEQVYVLEKETPTSC